MSEQQTVMLVEDEEEQSSILAKTFRENGYRTVVVTSAEAALDKLSQIVPDVILADIKLTGMDGLQLFNEVKKRGLLDRISFIFLTAYNSMQMAIDAKKQGAANYIVKPYDLEYLVDTVKDLLVAKAK